MSQVPNAVTVCLWGPAPGPFSEIWQEVGTQKGDLCPSAAEGLSGSSHGIQQAEDAEAQVLTPGSAAAFWQWRANFQPYFRPCTDML